MYASAVQSANDGSALSAPSEHRGIASSSSAGSQERQTNHRNSAKKPWSTCARVRRRVSGVHRLLISMRNALGVIGEVGRHGRVAGRNWHPRCDPRHLQSILDSSCATRVAIAKIRSDPALAQKSIDYPKSDAGKAIFKKWGCN